MSDTQRLAEELAWLRSLVQRGNVGVVELSDVLRRELMARIATILRQLGV